ncbi:MAG: RNA polymerase subunit sigma-70 [Okeania sp. SIO2D1]|nr:RNA polymerase subunit sigma-70 [Okeania sp. SIO2D1]
MRKHVEKICLSFGIKNDFPDERRSKRPDLIVLFKRFKPEWVKGGHIASPVTVSKDKRHDPFSLYNRDVFILVDQSGSMVRKDGDTGTQTRYEYLAEIVEGHASRILSYTTPDQEGRKICDRLSMLFFSRKRTPPQPIIIDDASQVWKLFIENQPKTKTFICPTLEHCINSWLETSKNTNRGAFFIIYTDGQFDDEESFVNCIAAACNGISYHQEVKFFVLGLGEDIDNEHFLALDFNVNQTMPFNVLVFDLVNEVEDIIELLSRQLTAKPHLAFPDWVKIRYPHFVEQVLQVEGYEV